MAAGLAPEFERAPRAKLVCDGDCAPYLHVHTVALASSPFGRVTFTDNVANWRSEHRRATEAEIRGLGG